MSNAFLTGFRGYAMHYAGTIDILHKGVRTMISAGLPVCGTKSKNAEWTLDDARVTCKRCIRLIDLDLKTQAARAAEQDK